jgi:hypothetical protein
VTVTKVSFNLAARGVIKLHNINGDINVCHSYFDGISILILTTSLRRSYVLYWLLYQAEDVINSVVINKLRTIIQIEVFCIVTHIQVPS